MTKAKSFEISLNKTLHVILVLGGIILMNILCQGKRISAIQYDYTQSW